MTDLSPTSRTAQDIANTKTSITYSHTSPGVFGVTSAPASSTCGDASTMTQRKRTHESVRFAQLQGVSCPRLLIKYVNRVTHACICPLWITTSPSKHSVSTVSSYVPLSSTILKGPLGVISVGVPFCKTMKSAETVRCYAWV